LATVKHAYISQLEEVWQEIFDFRFFHDYESVPPRPLSIQTGAISNCYENLRKCPQFYVNHLTGVNDTGDIVVIAGNNDNDDNFLPVPTTPAMKQLANLSIYE
jgi:hypothetical protein